MTRLRLWHAFFRPALVLALPLLLILQLSGPALALTDDQTLVVDVWRLVNESYVDSSFSGVPWRTVASSLWVIWFCGAGSSRG